MGVGDLDDIEGLIETFAIDVPFRFDGTMGTCKGWPGRQDREVKAVEGVRLSVNQRDFMIVANTLPRAPKSGDQFQFFNTWFTVRPRGDDCYSPADRAGQLLRVYCVK